MIILGTIFILTLISGFSIILGNSYVSGIVNVGIDTESIVDGSTSTFVVASENVLFTIDASSIVGALTILSISIIAIALIVGITVLASGINPQSGKIIIIITAYVGVWSMLSIVAFPLIVSIEVFGSIIYVSLTVGYVIGVIQKLTGGG